MMPASTQGTIKIVYKIFVCVFLIIGAIGFANDSGASVSQAIDSDGDVGPHTAIAVDSQNKVHISYSKGGYFHFNETDDLKYATNASGTWTVTSVDSVGEVGTFTAIAVDSADHVHISYFDSTERAVLYASDSSGIWQIARIDGSDYGNPFTSIAVDSADKIHISYLRYAMSQGSLKYATNVSGSWETEIVADNVANTSNKGMQVPIAVDSNDRVHIAYSDQADYAVRLATNESGSWRSVAVGDLQGEYVSLALDLESNVHISCYSLADQVLRYATNQSGAWVVATIDGFGENGQVLCYSAIACDQSDVLQVAYFYPDGRDLKFASIRKPDFDVSGDWLYATTANWVADPIHCAGDSDESGSARLTQIGNSLSGTINGVEFSGIVSGKDYTFYAYDYDTDTVFWANLTASSAAKASGPLLMRWWGATSTCEGGNTLTLSKDSAPISDGGDSGGGGGGGSSGGGCFIAGCIIDGR